MDMYTIGSELRISAENISEFKVLLEKARKEAEQLNNTIAQLSRFEFSILFSFDKTVGVERASDTSLTESTIKNTDGTITVK